MQQWRTSSTVISAAPISTTNITGFFMSVERSSFTNESHDRASVTPSVPERLISLLGLSLMAFLKKSFLRIINRCSRIGPRLRAGKKVSALTIKTTEVSRQVNSGVVTGNMPGKRGQASSAPIAGDSQHGNYHEKPAKQHGRGQRRVVPKGVGVESSESRAVVRAGFRIGIKDFR